MSSRATRAVEVETTLMACLALMACSAAQDAPPQRASGFRASGPWAAEIEREYDKATSPEVRNTLEDGVVSDREYEEMKTRYVDCLASAGVTMVTYGPAGSEYTFAPPVTADIAHQKDRECSASSGEYPIGYFYTQMRVNPANEDVVPHIVECLKREGLVEKSYTVKDYAAGDFSFAEDGDARATFDSCNSDPMGRLGG
ncbi:hypothetical protein [Leifsonia naganoensis]|uniref:Lipoprotein n=1 Tax=Leifsonia naganoensis TaxID=150025 RepID=A0A853DNK0_9MICO|nr:hypothetical protein [Leifsonia naganoensis]NYK10732.1 hypothetical protein [Leifsonia naganoensis]